MPAADPNQHIRDALKARGGRVRVHGHVHVTLELLDEAVVTAFVTLLDSRPPGALGAHAPVIILPHDLELPGALRAATRTGAAHRDGRSCLACANATLRDAPFGALALMVAYNAATASLHVTDPTGNRVYAHGTVTRSQPGEQMDYRLYAGPALPGYQPPTPIMPVP